MKPSKKSGAISPGGQEMPAGLRRYLYFTATVTGAAILIVEILGAKMLSPYVGTSHFVWTAQIAVTLVSLALGYYFGGWLVDRSSQLGRLYFCILLAAVYLCCTIPAVEPVAYYCLRYKLAGGALLSSAFLFFVPLTLLATAGPFLVRVVASSLNVVGASVGKISGISTLGSVAGTILIGYVLIPFFSNSVIMFGTAGALMVLCAVYFFGWGRRTSQKLAHGTLIGVGALLGFLGVRADQAKTYPVGNELHRVNSNFGLLQVIESPGGHRRFYLNDYLIQNTYETAEQRSSSMFTYMLHELAWAYHTNIQQALCIGMGIGIVPMDLARAGVKVDVAEINPGVVDVASRFFGLKTNMIELSITDGRYFLNQTKRAYDAIVLDAFLGDSSPAHLMTREAFASMSARLGSNGVLVINSFGYFTGGKDFFMASLYKTLKSVFKNARIHASGNGNVFFVASNQPDFYPKKAPNLAAIPRYLTNDIQAAFDADVPIDTAHGQVLTDDFNPVEYYDAANRESFRRSLAMSMKKQNDRY